MLTRKREKSDINHGRSDRNGLMKQLSPSESSSQDDNCKKRRVKRGVSVVLLVFVPVVAVLLIVALLLFLLLKRNGAPCYSGRRGATCYHDNPRPYRYYSTKTDYRVLVDEGKLDDAREFVVPGCQAHTLFLLQRHTTRYPDREDIVGMRDDLPVILKAIQDAYKGNKVHICPRDMERLDNWTLRFVPDDDNKVTKSGEEVVYSQVRRFKKRFPALFAKPYNPDDFVVGYTSRERTLQTALAFLKELLSKEDYETALKHIGEPRDVLLQFHKECNKRLKKQQSADDKTVYEVDRFDKGSYMNSLLATVSWRLGIDVDKKRLKTISRACSFEYAVLDDAPWCAALEEDDWKVLEFREDLDDYYKDGYGRERNYAQACPVIAELVLRLGNASTVPNYPTKLLYFSHAGGFKKVVARLGLLRDQTPLKADNYCSQTARLWRSSRICPFNANLAFVLFKCRGREDIVATFLNEQLQRIPGCPSVHCPLKTFLSLYRGVAEKCTFDEICST